MSLDPKQVLGVVLSHLSARDNTIQHVPYWHRVCDRILLYTPVGQRLNLNDPRITEYEAFVDSKFHAGDTVNRRIHTALKEALKTDYRYIILFEYDSLCWGPIWDRAVPPEGSMGSCLFHNEDYDVIPGKHFESPIYLHFPHLYTRTALEKMLAVAERGEVAWDAEHGYVDRWLGFLAHKAGVPVLNYRANGLGYSYENISYGGRYPQRVDEAAHAVANGAIFSHGVKDRRTLERIARNGRFGVL